MRLDYNTGKMSIRLRYIELVKKVGGVKSLMRNILKVLGILSAIITLGIVALPIIMLVLGFITTLVICVVVLKMLK